MFPNGFYPEEEERDRGGLHCVKTIPRHKASGPVRYYFIDLSISRLYGPGEEHLAVEEDGGDRCVPEMSNADKSDSFSADVYILGKVFKEYFIPVRLPLLFLLFSNTEFYPRHLSRNTKTSSLSPRSLTQ